MGWPPETGGGKRPGGVFLGDGRFWGEREVVGEILEEITEADGAC